jgi:hypothetical protein
MENEAACFFMAERCQESAGGSTTGLGGSEASGGCLEGKNQNRSERPHRLHVLRRRPSERGCGTDIGMQGFVAQALGGRCGFDCFNANLIGVKRGKVTHRVTSATLTADDEQTGNHDCTDRALDDPSRGRIARRKLAGKQPSPDQPISARVHRQSCFR